MDKLPTLDEVRAEAERRGQPLICRDDGAVFLLDEYAPFSSGNHRAIDIRFIAYPARWQYRGSLGTGVHAALLDVMREGRR